MCGDKKFCGIYVSRPPCVSQLFRLRLPQLPPVFAIRPVGLLTHTGLPIRYPCAGSCKHDRPMAAVQHFHCKSYLLWRWYASKTHRPVSTPLFRVPRACLKIHSHHLYALLCGKFCPHPVNAALYIFFIRTQFPTNCDTYLTENNLQTRSGPDVPAGT